MNLNFEWVSPFAPEDRRGGWAGMSGGLLRGIEGHGVQPRILAPLRTETDRAAKWLSRALTLLARRRLVWSASEASLRAVARRYMDRSHGGDAVLFFGSGDYLATFPDRPFAVYLDSALVPFLDSYAAGRRYLRGELRRLAARENAWLSRCSRIFTTSDYARRQILERYSTDADRVVVAGTGPNGDCPIPGEAQVPASGSAVLFISTDFDRKGGRLALEALALARRRVPGLTLHIVGRTPPDVQPSEGIVLHGWVDRASDEGRAAYERIMRTCRLFLMLSEVDLTPAAICEAAAWGLPTLAMAVGGIPEMVQDGTAGWLLEPGSGAACVADALVRAVAGGQLETVGYAARKQYEAVWNWEAVSGRVLRSLREVVQA